MKDYDQQQEDDIFTMKHVMGVMRALGALLGVIAIIMGLVYASRMFALIFDALHEPELFRSQLATWAAAIGGDELDLVIAGASYPVANVLALLVLGVGALVLTWLALGLVLAGAKTVSWCLGDREAVKRILVHAFGRKGQPEKKPGPGLKRTSSGRP